MKKIIVITGTSSGLGFETAIRFAQANYKVYATMRSLKKSHPILERKKKENLDIEVLVLDVTKPKTIELAIKEIIDKEGRIDILINNAGGGFVKTTEEASEEEMQWVTDLNYFGVVRCTKAVLPIMRKQKSGHIINISSIGGLVGQPFNELYCAAKFAVEGYTEAMSTYLTDYFGIKFTIIEPGGISSNFFKAVNENTFGKKQIADSPYLPILQKYIGSMQNKSAEEKQQLYQTPNEVATIVLQIAENKNPPLRVRTSPWSENFCRLKTLADPDGTKLLEEVKNTFLA